MICSKLIGIVEEKAKRHFVQEVRVGLGYTAVQLDNHSCGIAYTFRDYSPECCSVLKQAGSFKGRNAWELVNLFVADSLLEVSLGLATINALADCQGYERYEGGLEEILEIEKEDKVGVIGDFIPLIDRLKKTTDHLFVFERGKLRRELYTPYQKIKDILPKCSVVIITSTTLINKTFEGILSLVKDARIACMLGPSTPLVPDFFQGSRINLLSGVEIVNPERVLQVVSEGGGMQQLKDCVKKVNLKL